MNKLKNSLIRRLLIIIVLLSISLSVFPVFAFAAPGSFVTAKHIRATGEKYIGVPYQIGGRSPAAFDCQGFTRFVFAKHGIRLPSGARRQATVGTHVSLDQLQQGDLVFFSTPATIKYPAHSIKRIGHVGIYIGHGKVLHTYGKPGITISNLRSPWWRGHYVSARRILG